MNKNHGEPRLSLPLFAQKKVGDVFKRARQAKGLTIADVATELRFSKERIELLEASDWENLPEPVYVRGYIRSYSKLLNLDAEALCTLYEEGAPNQVARKVGWLNNGGGRPANLSSLWFKVTVFSLIVLGGSMMLIWWYGTKQQNVSYDDRGVQGQTINPLEKRYPIIE